MKRILIIMLFFAIIVSNIVYIPKVNSDDERNVELVRIKKDIASGYYAIIIGINDYMSASISNLMLCESDAHDVKDALIKYCGYNPDNVTLLTGSQANRRIIESILEDISNPMLYPNAKALLVYFSGHGASLNGINYLLPYDGSADSQDFDTHNLSLNYVKTKLNDSLFPKKLVFIDACRNEIRADGKTVGEEKGFTDLPNIYEHAIGTKFLLSTLPGNISREDRELGNGLFTSYLIEDLSGEAAGNDGVITIGRLEEFIFTKMAAYSRRNPERKQIPLSKGEGSSSMEIGVVDLNMLASMANEAVHSIAEEIVDVVPPYEIVKKEGIINAIVFPFYDNNKYPKGLTEDLNEQLADMMASKLIGIENIHILKLDRIKSINEYLDYQVNTFNIDLETLSEMKELDNVGWIFLTQIENYQTKYRSVWAVGNPDRPRRLVMTVHARIVNIKNSKILFEKIYEGKMGDLPEAEANVKNLKMETINLLELALSDGFVKDVEKLAIKYLSEE